MRVMPQNLFQRAVVLMATDRIEQRALQLLNAFENAGKAVSRVTVEGKRIELVLSKEREDDEYAGIDMRHDQT